MCVPDRVVAGSVCERCDASPEVLGRWTSSDPEYADRSFTLTQEAFVLDLGSHGTENYVVVGVHREELPDDRVYYEVSYEDDGVEDVEYKFSFFHEQAQGSALIMKNRPNVSWRKREAEL